MNDDKIKITINDVLIEHWEKIKEIAKKEDRSASSIMRGLIKTFVESEPQNNWEE